MMKITNHTIQVEDHPVHYKMIGHGEPLVLIHGLSGSTRWWKHNVTAIAQHYQVYLVDLPGFGSMRHSPTRFILNKAANWLYLWMQAVGISQADIIGHSMGGCISIQLTAHHPDAVRRLVLVAPAGIPTTHSPTGYLKPLLSAIRYMTPSFLPILLTDALRAGPFTLLRATEDLLVTDIRNDLPLITVPTLLIWGENDMLVPVVLGDILHKAILNSHLLILKNAGHIVMFDRPHEFNNAVLTFLAGLM